MRKSFGTCHPRCASQPISSAPRFRARPMPAPYSAGSLSMAAPDVFMRAKATLIGRRALETDAGSRIGNKKEWSIRLTTPGCLGYGRLYVFYEKLVK